MSRDRLISDRTNGVPDFSLTDEVMSPTEWPTAGAGMLELRQILSADQRTFLGVDTMITTLVWLLRGYDEEIYEHSCHVADWAVRIGQAMGLKSCQLLTLQHAGLLHDFGKLALPRHFWRKSGAFSPDEVRLARRHPRFGSGMLAAVRGLAAVLPGVRYHHERFDGSGYPYGLSGDRIPLIARILAVADSYSAMTTARSYRRAISNDDACRELVRCAGRQFDPFVVRIFLHLAQPTFVD
jgi:HD-GYP domain-containing protein (c-di-GMP phosphodiesterase class II)